MTSSSSIYFSGGRDNDDGHDSGLRNRYNNSSSNINSIDRNRHIRSASGFGLDGTITTSSTTTSTTINTNNNTIGLDEQTSSSSSSSFIDTPINDRRKPPIKSITNNVDMSLFTSPGGGSRSGITIATISTNNTNTYIASKLGIRSPLGENNTPTRRTSNNRRSMMYNENTNVINNAYHNNPITTTPNRQVVSQQIDQYSNQHHHHQQHHHTSTTEAAYNTTDKAYHYWILVSGLNNNDNQSISSLLLHFQEYGDICEHMIGKGNWVFLRFTTPSAANESLRANRDIVNNNIIIVEKLDVTLAHKLGVALDGGSLVSTDSNGVVGSRISSNRNTPTNVARVSIGEGLFDQNAAYKDFMSPINRYQQVDRRDTTNPLYMPTPNRYLQPPIKKKSCCKWIMEAFGLNY